MTCNCFFLFFCLFTFYELSERPTSQLRNSFNHQKFRNVQKLCHAVNILDAFDIYEDCSLQSIRSMDLFDLFPCYMHHIAFARLKSHTPFPCPPSQLIYIFLKFQCVLCIPNFSVANTVIHKVLFQNQCLLRYH